MSKTIGLTKKVVFRLRWAVMSQERRYACLLARTKRSQSQLGAGLLAANN
jgi:hypothetical protein